MIHYVALTASFGRCNEDKVPFHLFNDDWSENTQKGSEKRLMCSVMTKVYLKEKKSNAPQSSSRENEQRTSKIFAFCATILRRNCKHLETFCADVYGMLGFINSIENLRENMFSTDRNCVTTSSWVWGGWWRCVRRSGVQAKWERRYGVHILWNCYWRRLICINNKLKMS